MKGGGCCWGPCPHSQEEPKGRSRKPRLYPVSGLVFEEGLSWGGEVKAAAGDP